MFAEEFPERGSIAEIKLVGNLLDGQLGIAQKNGRLDNQKVGNGLAGAFAGIVLADFGQVMGGYVQFSGIEADRMFLENMGFEQGKIAAAKESRPGRLWHGTAGWNAGRRICPKPNSRCRYSGASTGNILAKY